MDDDVDAGAGFDDILVDEGINDDDLAYEDQGQGGESTKVMSYTQIIQHIAKTPKRTFPFLTKYEKTRLIGVRMEQLSRGAKPNISTKGLLGIREIAEEELRQRKTPFIVQRMLPNGNCEYWKIEEFEKI
jgi:DNA-directed RNA polymerase I, II, and III subunit RPABC2